MSEAGIQSAMLRFLRDRFGIEVPSPDTDLIEAGILDSLMIVDVVMYIEEQFSVTTQLDDLELENFATVGNMARFVAARQRAGGLGDLGTGPAMAAESGERPIAEGEGRRGGRLP